MAVQLGCFAGACDPATRSTAEVRSSLIEDNHDIGVQASGSDVTLDSVVVRNTLPRALDALFGRGVEIRLSCFDFVCDPDARGNATVRNSLVEATLEHGVLVAGADATFEGVVVRGTVARAADGLLGDGITLFSFTSPASGILTNSRIDHSARAGLSSFGGTATLGSTHITCAPFELDGEPWDGQDPALRDPGGNACGCPHADQSCRMVSGSLQPLDPL
jgi:hypothetical protein